MIFFSKFFSKTIFQISPLYTLPNAIYTLTVKTETLCVVRHFLVLLGNNGMKKATGASAY